MNNAECERHLRAPIFFGDFYALGGYENWRINDFN